MEYANIKFLKQSLDKENVYSQMIETLKNEVIEFASSFRDDPSKVSAWGHHYFCPKDGGLLIYTRETPTEHKCEICGQIYDDELFNNVWVYMYRNEAIINVWKSALLYKLTNDIKYLNIVKKITGYYSDNYLKFKLHNKEGLTFDTIEEMKWGCGRIMPQGLNESIFIIRMINALELVKDDIGEEFLKNLNENLFKEAFKLLKPQVDKIHNISCWKNSAIGIMGLFTNNKEMLDFVFNGEFNIRRQLREGVTVDRFWYEGSIHYNFFTLEGITNLLLFSELYNFDFGVEKEIVREMFVAAYKYAFDNHQLPNPNDGWPNLNLKTYSYIYSVATKIFGIDSEIGNLLKNILKSNAVRTELPLSRPYYFNNEVSLERLILIPEINPEEAIEVESKSINFTQSNFGILKKNRINIFYKYGHNGPSHAHPDKMNIEVVIGDYSLSRDLSNSGYGNQLCNEWHRMSTSHNTVVVNGENHVSMERGKSLDFRDNLLEAEVIDVYPGVDFRRKIEITDDGFIDEFSVNSNKENICDYFFHVEAELITDYKYEETSLIYKENGYQHISNPKKIIVDKPYVELEWKLGNYLLIQWIDLENKELFIGKSPDNPINKERNTLIVRGHQKDIRYKSKWTIKKGE